MTVVRPLHLGRTLRRTIGGIGVGAEGLRLSAPTPSNISNGSAIKEIGSIPAVGEHHHANRRSPFMQIVEQVDAITQLTLRNVARDTPPVRDICMLRGPLPTNA